MKTKLYTFLFFSLILISCSENKNKLTNSGEIDLESAIDNAESRRKLDPNASGGNSCLLDYQSKYDQLVSETDVLTATGFSKEKLETKYQKVMKSPEYHEFLFKFKNKRIGKVRGLTREMEIPDIVKVRGIKAMSLNDFENNYRALTDEEMDLANQAVDDILEGKSGEAEAEAAVKKAEEQNISKEQVKEVSGELMDAFKEVSEGYRKVMNLGDAARWNLVTNELVVLQNGVKFELMIDVSNDPKINQKVAFDLAQIILNKCK